ncbi:MAG: efflux RND transporter periplasmic adaptor subunit [Lachnospiraceae bacterium]|nr:efflux RND transporter periplasmic adaptor subunit [Lachnospiraceae bacterium]
MLVTENHLVDSVKVKVGDEVEEGDVLFELSAPPTSAGASVAGTEGVGLDDDDSTIRQAQQELDTLELEYNKALLELSPTYDKDNLEIRSAREDLEEALVAQQKAAGRDALKARQNVIAKELIELEAEITELEEKAATVSGNSAKKTNKKLVNKQKKKADLTAENDNITTQLASLPSVEEAAATVREKQKALDALNIDLNDKKRTDGSESGKSRLDLAAQRKKIEDQREHLEKLKNKESLSGDFEITAKNGGIIKQINCIAGDTVTPDSALALIAVTGNGYSASFSVTNEQSKLVHPGQEASIMNIWGDDINATLNAIKPDLEKPNTNKVLVFSITGDDVTVGQTLELSVGEKSAPYDIVVPNSAIREDNNGKFVLVVNVKSSPLGNRYVLSRAEVSVIASDDSNSAVSGSLYEYQYVVTNTSKPVEAGMKVRLSDS